MRGWLANTVEGWEKFNIFFYEIEIINKKKKRAITQISMCLKQRENNKKEINRSLFSENKDKD